MNDEKNLQTPTSKLDPKSTNPNNREEKKVIATAMRYEGPIPPASELEKYNNIVPGCASILIDMAVKNSEHRRYPRIIPAS